LEACTPDGLLLGLDLDPQALALARETLAPFEGRVRLVQASHTTLREQLAAAGWDAVDGTLLDLGASSMQFDSAERGFSFLQDGPLDMRFDLKSLQTAADLVNNLAEKDLAALIFENGEEKRSRRIARAIVANRPFHTTRELSEVIEKAAPRRGERLHPATRTFQALRIAVNDELAALEKTLPQAVEGLRSKGRCAVISFHSLEDRIVKNFFKEQSQEKINPLYERIHEQERKAVVYLVNRKPITPSEQEMRENPRARSAKLRVIEKV
jgi:16S rRNA (cytosine1402-N4)-methyltransferase